MNYEETILSSKLTPDLQTWVSHHQDSIYLALFNQFSKVFPQTSVDESFFLGEFGLCEAMKNISLPEGFVIPPNGQVEVFDPVLSSQSLTKGKHVFAVKGETVLCFTAPQFVDYQYGFNLMKPGQRIDLYYALAPDLFTKSTKGFGVLYGTKDQILLKLNLHYIF